LAACAIQYTLMTSCQSGFCCQKLGIDWLTWVADVSLAPTLYWFSLLTVQCVNFINISVVWHATSTASIDCCCRLHCNGTANTMPFASFQLRTRISPCCVRWELRHEPLLKIAQISNNKRMVHDVAVELAQETGRRRITYSVRRFKRVGVQRILCIRVMICLFIRRYCSQVWWCMVVAHNSWLRVLWSQYRRVAMQIWQIVTTIVALLSVLFLLRFLIILYWLMYNNTAVL